MRKLSINARWLASFVLLCTALPIAATDKNSRNPQVIPVRGQVTDNNRKPVANAHVRFFLEWWDEESIGCAMGIRDSIEAASIQTDGHGRYNARIVTSQIKNAKLAGKAVFSTITIVATYPEKGLNATSRPLSKVNRPINLRLEAEKVLTGTVKGPDGRPVAGARVGARYVSEKVNDLRPNTLGLFVPESTGFLKTVTDAQGRFSLRNLPHGSHIGLDVTPRESRLANTATRIVMDAPAQSWDDFDNNSELSGDSRVNITLPLASTLTLKATWDDSQKPAAGVWLQLGSSNAHKQVRLDSQGSIVLRGLPPGTYHAVLRPQLAQTTKYTLRPFKVVIEPGKDVLLTQTLDPGVIVKGRVSDAYSNKPLGESVSFVRDTIGPEEEWGQESGTPIRPDGTFQIALAPGRYSYRAFGLPADYPDHNNQRYDDIEIVAGKTPSPLLLKFNPIPLTTLQIVDSQNRPAPNAWVALDSIYPQWPDSRGRIVFRGLGRFEGDFVSAVEQDRGLAALTSIKPDEKNFIQRVVLHPISRGVGRITDNSGKPIAGAKIVAMVQMERTGRGSNSVVSDARGNFTMDLFPLATYSYTINAPGYGEIDTKKFRTEPGKTHQIETVKLAKADLAISGKVVDESGNPVKDARVDVSGAGQNDFRPESRTDASGRFDVQSLVPGKVYVSVRGGGKYARQSKYVDAGSHDLVVVLTPRKAGEDEE